MVKFLKINAKNFLSIGNSEFEFLFEKGLTNFIGDNGSGKSVISDIISVCLYGKPFRKIKQASLINKQNKKDCLISIEFMKDSTHVKVVRGFKPDVFDVIVDGNPLKKMAEKKDHQQELENIIGIPHDVFKQSVVLSTTKSTKNFLELSAQEMRDIVSSIFSLEYIDRLATQAKQNVSELKLDIKVLDSSIAQYTQEVGSYEKLISDAESTSDKTELKNRLAELKSEGIKLVEEHDVLVREIEAKNLLVTNAINAMSEMAMDGGNPTKLYSEAVSKYQLALELVKGERSLLQKGVSVGTTCKSCGSLVTEETIERKKKSHEDEISKLESVAETARKKMEHLKVKADIYDGLDKDAQTLTSEVRAYETRKQTLLLQIGNKKSMMNTLRDSLKASGTMVSGLETTLAEVKSKKTEAITKRDEDIKLKDVYETLVKKVLVDDGVKAFYIERFIPILNKKVNDRLVEFSMPFAFSFARNLSFTIFSVLNNSEFEYGMMSEGQKKKLDIAISLSFIDVMKLISKWDTNLIVFDEVLDSGLDKKSTESVIRGLKESFCVDGNNKSVIIISHKIDNDVLFDRTIEAVLDDGFSTYSWS